LNNTGSEFSSDALAIAEFIMRWIGYLDAAISHVMILAGLGPERQTELLLVLTVVLVVLALRVLGGLLGWLTLIVLLLLLLHHIVPGILPPQVGPAPLQNAL
jgi:hypothetical protein